MKREETELAEPKIDPKNSISATKANTTHISRQKSNKSDQDIVKITFDYGPQYKKVSRAKKLVVVWVTSLSVTKAIIENTFQPLESVSHMHHPFYFPKNPHETRALIELDNKFNLTSPAFVAKLDLKVRKIDIKAQKIDGSIFIIFKMASINFQVEDKLDKIQFCQETFVVANTTLEVIFEMLFFIFNNIDIQFALKELI